MTMPDGNSAAELQHDLAQMKRERAAPTGAKKEQWIYEWITRKLETDQRAFVDVLADIAILNAPAIGAWAAQNSATEIGLRIITRLYDSMQPAAEEAFDEHDFSAEEV